MVRHRLRINTYRTTGVPSPLFSEYTLIRLIEEYPFIARWVNVKMMEHFMGIKRARILLNVLILATPVQKLKKMRLDGEAYLKERTYRDDLGKLTIFLGETPNGRGRIRLKPFCVTELKKLVDEGFICNTNLGMDQFLHDLGRLKDILELDLVET